MKNISRLFVVLLILFLVFSLFACDWGNGGNSSSGKKTDERIDYAKTPLSADSESSGSGKGDNWRGFKCRAYVTAPTSEFPVDDVTVTFSFEGDFSDENAAYFVERFDEVEYCDLSNSLIEIISTQAVDSYSFDYAEKAVKNLNRQDDYSNGKCNCLVKIPEEYFFRNVGWIKFVVKGETRQQGVLSDMSKTVIVSYWKKDQKVLLSADPIAFLSNKPYLTYVSENIAEYNPYELPVGVSPSGDSLFVGETIDDAFEKDNYCAFLLDEQKVRIKLKRNDDDTFEPMSFFSASYDMLTDDNGKKPTENIYINYYFGGLNEGRVDYEYVELYFVDKLHLENGAYFYKRIDDYTDDKYDCKRIVSLNEETVYVDYSHSETMIVPESFKWEERGELCLLVMGKEREKDGLSFLSGVSISYSLDKNISDQNMTLVLFDQYHDFGYGFVYRNTIDIDFNEIF